MTTTQPGSGPEHGEGARFAELAGVDARIVTL